MLIELFDRWKSLMWVDRRLGGKKLITKLELWLALFSILFLILALLWIDWMFIPALLGLSLILFLNFVNSFFQSKFRTIDSTRTILGPLISKKDHKLLFFLHQCIWLFFSAVPLIMLLLKFYPSITMGSNRLFVAYPFTVFFLICGIYLLVEGIQKIQKSPLGSIIFGVFLILVSIVALILLPYAFN